MVAVGDRFLNTTGTTNTTAGGREEYPYASENALWSLCRCVETSVGGPGIVAGTTNYIYYTSSWQPIETRTNGTAVSNVSSQMVWSAAYINAAVLQDTYSGGVIQPNSRLYFLQDASWNTTAVIGYDRTAQTWNVVQRYLYSPYGNITILNAAGSATPTGTTPDVINLYQGRHLDRVTSQDPLQYINGANTYQFVMGNPIIGDDPFGLWTISIGISINIQWDFNWNFSVCGMVDSEGHVGGYFVGGGLVGAGADGTAGLSVQVSNAKTICDLRGPYGNVKAGLGDGVGIEGNGFAGGSPDGNVIGGGITVGAGLGGGWSTGATGTAILADGNVMNVYKVIMGVLFAAVFVIIYGGGGLELLYSTSLPGDPQVQTGHVYRMTVNHGFVVYRTNGRVPVGSTTTTFLLKNNRGCCR